MAVWIILVTYTAELSKFSCPPNSWSCVQISLVASAVSLRVFEKESQSAFFQFHLSVVGGRTWLSLLAVISYLIISWSEDVGLSSSTAQFETRSVICGEENVKSKTDDPFEEW